MNYTKQANVVRNVAVIFAIIITALMLCGCRSRRPQCFSSTNINRMGDTYYKHPVHRSEFYRNGGCAWDK